MRQFTYLEYENMQISEKYRLLRRSYFFHFQVCSIILKMEIVGSS
jgi:hypothetical protein